MLCASSVQEAHDFAAVSHAATLRTRVPFLHFFDGFRTSHEINRIDLLDDADLRSLVRADTTSPPTELRRLRPTAPVMRGTAQNPDVFFQAREAANPYHDAVPAAVERGLRRTRGADRPALRARRLRRRSRCRTRHRDDGVGRRRCRRDRRPARSTTGRRSGLLTVRLFRPFPVGRAPRRAARDRPVDRRARPDQGAGCRR